MPELLPLGSRAPDFSLPASDGQMVTLSQLIQHHHVVLVFYVANQTPD